MMSLLRRALDRLTGKTRGSGQMTKKVIVDLPDVEQVFAEFQRRVSDVSDIEHDSQLAFSVDHWAKPDRVRGYITVYEQGLRKQLPNYGESVGLDFGCWTGFSSLLLKLLGARHVIGVDVSSASVDAARNWTDEIGETHLDFFSVENGEAFALPLPDNYFDWAIVGQVYCNMNPGVINDALDEITRVLRPGGTIYLNDSNNPHNPEVVTRLLGDYEKFELGEGTREKPEGEIFFERREIIEGHFPQIDSNDLDRLAKNTCYLWKPEIITAVEQWIEQGEEPVSPFEAGVLKAVVRANLGNAATNPTDPVAIANEFIARGLTVEISGTPGGQVLSGSELDEMLASQGPFHLYANKPADAGGSCFDLSFAPYDVIENKSKTVESILTERHYALHMGYGPDFSEGARHKKIPSADFSEFEDLLDRFLELDRHHICPVGEIHRNQYPSDKIPLCFKHDIDGDIEAALWMAEAEAHRGIRGTFYLLHTAPYYGEFTEQKFSRFSEMGAIYRQIQNLGHEVGLHFNPLQVYRDHGVDGKEALQTELEWMREIGLNVRVAFGHSSAAALGAESIEFFIDHLAVNADMVSRISAAKHGIYESKGIKVPRLVSTGREFGIENFGEFLLRGLEYSYWSVLSQERCRPAPNPRLTLPSYDTCVSEMLNYIKHETNTPFQMINIHPETYGLRAAPEREEEKRVRQSGVQSQHSSELGYTCYLPRTVQSSVRKETGWANINVVHVSNSLGMLDYEPLVSDAKSCMVFILGGSRVDGINVAVPAQLQSWLRDHLTWRSHLPLPIVKMARPGADATEYIQWMRRGESVSPMSRVIIFFTRELLNSLTQDERALEKMVQELVGPSRRPVLAIVDDWGGEHSELAFDPREGAEVEARLNALNEESVTVSRLASLIGNTAGPVSDEWLPVDHETVAKVLAELPWLQENGVQS